MKLSDPYNVAEFRSRATGVAIWFCILLGLLLMRLWYLQIWQGEVYRGFSDKNRFKIERLSAPRGQLLDRNGLLLADSRPRFDLHFVRGNSANLETELKILQDIFKWKDEDFEKKVERVKKAPRYQAQLVEQDVTSDELAHLESQSLDLPGVDIEVNAVRDYLYKDVFFHSVGYTGQINEIELPRLKDRFPERNYRLGDQKGIAGIESVYEGLLRGVDGRDFVVVDVRGRRVNQNHWELLPSAVRVDPEAGLSLELSLDFDLQNEAVKAFGNQQGSVVAMDPQTGEILAYVSRPALDPNLFTRVISSADFQKMMNQVGNPFLDRVVGEHYPPGSTLKILMAAAALQSGTVSERTAFHCGGTYRLGRRVWNCWERGGHGAVNIVQAIERSCDVFFYNVGSMLGLDAMFSWASRFGLGRRTYIGNEAFNQKLDRLARFNSEVPGFIPNVDWVEQKGNTTVEAETINAAIGQGAFTMTALQLVRMISAVGNGGKIFQPQLVLSAKKPSGEVIQRFLSHLENQIQLKPSVRELVLKGLEQVVAGSLGTARASRLQGIDFGGKTGTAQVVALDMHKVHGKSNRKLDDHALFIGMAPLRNPKIAVAVVVENGLHGSSAAAPIAKALVKNYLDRQQALLGEGAEKSAGGNPQ